MGDCALRECLQCQCTMQFMSNLLEGKVALVLGIANRWSLAYAVAQAYSREGMGDTVPFAAAEAWAEKVLGPLLAFDSEPKTLINVNFPAIAPKEVKGVRVCRQGIRDYGRLRIVQPNVVALGASHTGDALEQLHGSGLSIGGA